MSPLVPNTLRGYKDWQRIVNWDSEALTESFSHELPGGIELPKAGGSYPVERYLALGVSLLCKGNAGGMVLMELLYGFNQALTHSAGERRIAVVQATASPLAARLVNLGPFVRINLTPLGAVLPEVNYIFYGSNRFAPVEALPTHALAMESGGVLLKVEAQAIVYPQDYFGGPVVAHIVANQPKVYYAFESLNASGTWVETDSVESKAKENITFHSQLVLGAWRVRIINNSGVEHETIVNVTPALTGST